MSKRGSRNKAAPKDRKVPPQDARAAVSPGVLEDYAFKAPKTTIIRVVACAAAGQVCLAMGFAPAFWLKMEFLDVATRGLFIASLLGVSSGLCYAAVKIQRRYVSCVAKSILSKSVAISEPFFLFTRTVQVEPKSIKLSPVSIRDLIGRPHTPLELEARSKVPLSQLALFTIEVKGKKMLVDTDGMTPEDRLKLHRVLGVVTETETGSGSQRKS